MVEDSAETDLFCEVCERSVERSAASVCGTMGDLDPEKWQTLCCPECGARLKTIFVGNEE